MMFQFGARKRSIRYAAVAIIMMLLMLLDVCPPGILRCRPKQYTVVLYIHIYRNHNNKPHNQIQHHHIYFTPKSNEHKAHTLGVCVIVNLLSVCFCVLCFHKTHQFMLHRIHAFYMSK